MINNLVLITNLCDNIVIDLKTFTQSKETEVPTKPYQFIKLNSVKESLKHYKYTVTTRQVINISTYTQSILTCYNEYQNCIILM